MKFNRTYLFTALGLFSLPTVFAEQSEQSATEQLDEIQVAAENNNSNTNPLSDVPKPNEIFLTKEKLQKKASTLGNALSGELGVHSSQFGGGASSPIIRGQEGVRLKILQNGLDVVDMSQLSPDHAVATDTLLADNVEIVRGASTLLYSTASTAGVVNVTDNRIPTQIPKNGYSVDLGLRYNDNNKEKVENAAVSLAFGQHFIIRMEGLNRNADNYRVPTLQFNDNTVNRLPNSFNKSKVAVIGATLVGERGHFGIAYSERKDIYGLVGHNHKFDSCYGHIVDPLNKHFINRYYLHPYPHLMDDTDVLEGAHFDCGSGHEDSNAPSHSHPFGHNIVGGPFIDMRLKRYEARAELKKPLPGISKVRINLAMSDYYHDEKEDKSNPVNLFKNKGENFRIELFHEPTGELRGVWGMQYQTQVSSAYVPRLYQPPRTRNNSGTETELDKIIKGINGANNTATQPAAPKKNNKPTLHNSSVNSSTNINALLKELFQSPKVSSIALNLLDEDEDDDLTDIENTNNESDTALTRKDSDFNLLPPSTFNLGDLLNNQNNKSKNKKPEDNKSDDNLVDKSQNSGSNSNAGISVDDLLSKINSMQPPPQISQNHTTNNNSTTATWKDRGTSDKRYALIENKVKQISLFGMEQLNWRDFMFEAGFRTELQTIHIDYDRELLERSKQVGISSKIEEPDLSPYREHATSYSSAAYWNVGQNYLLSLILSHNERLPTAMELYYHGKHLATNSFEYGNKDLQKEVSNNLEIGLNYQDSLWSYTLNVYYNRFKNRIFKRTLNKEGNLSMNRYAQGRADYYGIEGKLDYQLTSNTQIGIFGDYVRGILRDVPPLRLKDKRNRTYEIEATKDAPRVPPARLGFHLEQQFNDNISGSLQFTHTFPQRKTARLEDSTDGYNLLNAGLNYQPRFYGGEYTFFIEANNLLNQKIYSHTSFLPYVPQLGRNFVFGVNMSF